MYSFIMESQKNTNTNKARPILILQLTVVLSEDSCPKGPWRFSRLWVMLQYFAFLWKPHISLLLLMHGQSSSLSEGQTMNARLLTTAEWCYSSPTQRETGVQKGYSSFIYVGCPNASVSGNKTTMNRTKSTTTKLTILRDILPDLLFSHAQCLLLSWESLELEK